MELTNDFRVDVPVERAWAVLTDLERIAPCMPGAQLQEVAGNEHRGIVKVKVGPIVAQYTGVAAWVERDAAAHRAVLRAEGREVRGQGNAMATITATLSPVASGTAVKVVTDLTITGRVAQMGRGVLADVSARLLGQFVTALERDVLSAPDPAPAPAAPEAPAPEPAPEPVPAPEPAPEQPVEAAAPAAAKKAPKKAAAKAPAKKAAKAVAKKAAAKAPAKKVAKKAAAAKVVAKKAVADDVAKKAAPASTAPAKPVAASASTATNAAPRQVHHPEPQPVDLLDAAGGPLAKRVAPIVGVLFVLWLLRRLFGGRRGHT